VESTPSPSHCRDDESDLLDISGASSDSYGDPEYVVDVEDLEELSAGTPNWDTEGDTGTEEEGAEDRSEAGRLTYRQGAQLAF
jgi:hypothetical protein